MTTNAVANNADSTVGKRVKWFSALACAIVSALVAPSVASAQHSTSAASRDAFLSAVAEVETGGNARAVGRRGERGLYQFTHATWRQHTRRPFAEAHHPSTAREVAIRHYDLIRSRLVAAGLDPTAHRLAVAWNAGISRALAGKAPKSTRDYARRVSQLTNVYSARNMLIEKRSTEVSRAAESVAAVPVAPALSFAFDGDALPEPDLIAFDLSSSAAAPPVVAVDESVQVEDPVSFRLETPTPAANSPANSPPRRLIFATIGE